MRISIATSVYNNETKISSFLETAFSIADEVIIIDHFSTDMTTQICQTYSKVHLVKKHIAPVEQVKQWAINLCTGDLNMFIDIRDLRDEFALRQMLSLCSISHSLKLCVGHPVFKDEKMNK
ncbi:glycosyltransferase [Chryseobacterium sp. CFS15]|uniref:glycosyltransferase n=1 Tax=Chryseobacterium sp. CFS15 TaxID=2986946 RepID=UPI002806E5F5|nr:glycosyltransferase [Chryseobacterium sp. CFS15]MDQ8141444.1 glycosyltransferase [Chryseobacterium sp. CFS15]